MSSKMQSAVLGHALAGLMAGALAACGGEQKAPVDPTTRLDGDKGAEAEQTHTSVAPHACSGQNACKGQGGCAVAGQNECKGKNPCKGKGGCHLSPEEAAKLSEGEQAVSGAKNACRGQNACKGQGGCFVKGQNECKGKNPCKGKGGCNM